MAMLRSESSKNKLGLHASPPPDSLGPMIYFLDGPRLLEWIQRHGPYRLRGMRHVVSKR